MNEGRLKQSIARSLRDFLTGNLAGCAQSMFDTLGYGTDKSMRLNAPTVEEFCNQFTQGKSFDIETACLSDWHFVDLIFQLTKDELTAQGNLNFDSSDRVDNTIIESYLFFAIELKGNNYSRSQLASITREVNKLFPMPVMLVFKHGQTLTLSIIDRRLHKRDELKDVLEKVTLIKDIDCANPHRAHVEILFDLSLGQLQRNYQFTNFVELHRAWQKTLDTAELNKRFFQEISDWYFWARQYVRFPNGAPKDEEGRDSVSLIRLLTRLIFVWFLKEKRQDSSLVPDELFQLSDLKELIDIDDRDASTYYKAILQNLFFATLNQEMNTSQKSDKRKFRGKATAGQRDQHYMIHNVYRYYDLFKQPEQALRLFEQIPFLNGGLFECLDQLDPQNPKRILRIDGFSDRVDNPLSVPNFLFFSDEQTVDLNEVYGSKNKRFKVRGLIDIFNRYKFTITENTPLEEEIALDPELLGKVFENLLAAYNPETQATARKQTGSFYTPRAVVDYMVDESLVVYLKHQLLKREAGFLDFGSSQISLFSNEYTSGQQRLQQSLQEEASPQKAVEIEEKLRQLVSFEPTNPFARDVSTTKRLITAIDSLKVLDPAVGSGAFPMGMLQKLVFILRKLDPNNALWKAQQKEREIRPVIEDLRKAQEISYEQAREAAIAQLQERLAQIEADFANNEMDYPRKLFLIENCIYGVDIQPIAVQIAKLRFFISLIVEQRVDDNAPNRGILPLPNLETKFIAANTLISIDRPDQLSLQALAVQAKEQELAEVRHRIFTARTQDTKNKYRQRDRELREGIAALLKREGWTDDTATKLAQWNPYDQNASASFFDSEWMFGVKDGFDLCIGNPPYVRQEQIKHLKEQFKSQYECFTGTADLYVYFYERGLKLLKERGVLTFISSNKYFRAAYGQKLRQFLTTQTRIHRIIDFGDAPVFTASVDTTILLLEKGRGQNATFAALNWEQGQSLEQFETVVQSQSFLMPQAELKPQGWQFADHTALRLLEKLRRAGTPLGEYVNGRFYYGIKTGLNEAFVVDRATRDRLIAEHPSSAEVLKPFVRGRDVKRWVIDYADLYLIKIESSENKQHPWTDKSENQAEQVFAQTYPAIYRHFFQFREALIKRCDQGKFFWELRSCIYWQEFERSKVVWGNLATRPQFTIAGERFYLCAPANLVVSEENIYLLGILNSDITRFYINEIAATRQGGFIEYKPMYVTQIPIPPASEQDRKTIEALVQKCISAKGQNVAHYEAEINTIVARLYGLTDAERAIIEGMKTQ